MNQESSVRTYPILRFMKAPAVKIGIAAVLASLLCAGIVGFISFRRETAKDVFLLAVELGRGGAWDEAFALTHPDYRRYANIVNFKGDVSDLTNEVSAFSAAIILKGGWNSVQVRYEYKDQPDWGIFFELRPVNGKWLIADRGHWTSSEF